jgi:hypothetical protein
MKSIHAFSTLLPGSGTAASVDPVRAHSARQMNGGGSLRRSGSGSGSGSGSKTSALSSLLAIALLQGRFPRGGRD